MKVGDSHAAVVAAANQIRALAEPLTSVADLDRLVARAGDRRFVAIGEASHGTHEFYAWRADLSRRLIEEHGFAWIGVEGDWPDCWRVDRWVRGLENRDLDAAGVLAGFERWPTWMWANREVADFLDWLRDWNAARSREEQVGFYGLDVYSLWESLFEIMTWLEEHDVDALSAALDAWKCFLPYQEDPHRYGWSTRLVPEDCEDEVVDLLVAVRQRARPEGRQGDQDFDILQNAEVVAAAERYYRTMVRADTESWNLRDLHMADTVDRIAAHLGGKGLLWAHNTHVGDARATDMADAGMLNLGQLVRLRHGAHAVFLIGFASSGGTVLAADAWGSPDRIMSVPDARPPSHEWLLHAALAMPSVLVFGDDRTGPWLEWALGHRAIGVVYSPEREHGNFVPTVMGARYDALLWCERTSALQPLHREPRPSEPELETEPTGF
jgi:erythromycin esterase-like protein